MLKTEGNIIICIYRRLKREVLDQLPSKVRQMVVLDPSSVKVGRDMKISHKFVDKAKVGKMVFVAGGKLYNVTGSHIL